MSVHPVLAASVGTVLLGQILGTHAWAGIIVVVLADAAAVATSRHAGSTVVSDVDAGRPLAASAA